MYICTQSSWWIKLLDKIDPIGITTWISYTVMLQNKMASVNYV